MKNLITRTKEFLKRDSNIVLLIFCLALAAYFLCLPNQMFWDDEDFILKNAFIKDWQFWPKFFTDNVIAGNHLISNYWRPLMLGVFAVEWHLWADWAPGWHAASIACHAAAGALLFIVLNGLLKDRTLAILTALLWVVHPANSEAVVYPNSMGDSLAMLFILAGLYFYTRFRTLTDARSPGSYTLALAMYVLALLSKETGILLVAFIGLADFFFLSPQSTLLNKIKKITAALWPFVLIATIYLVLRATVLNFNNSFNFYNQDTAFTTHFDMRLATFFKVIALYAGFIFTPFDLRVERIIDPAKTFFSLDVLWGMSLCAGLIWLAVRNRIRRPAVTFGICWFFIGIAPTSNLLVIINAMVYEHFLYIAMVGIMLIVLIFSREWASGTRTKSIQQIWYMSLLILIALATLRTAWRCLDWRTSIGFYEQLLPNAPKSYRVINNLGMAYAENGYPQKAEETYKKAIALDPTNAVAYHNLANIYRDSARQGLARGNYEKAIELQPNFLFSYKSLAQIYLDQGEFTKARKLLEIYFGMSDEKAYILNILAEIAYREKAYSDAARYLKTLLQLVPGDPNTVAALQKLDAMMGK